MLAIICRSSKDKTTVALPWIDAVQVSIQVGDTIFRIGEGDNGGIDIRTVDGVIIVHPQAANAINVEEER